MGVLKRMNRTCKLCRSVKRRSGAWGTQSVPDNQLKNLKDLPQGGGERLPRSPLPCGRLCEQVSLAPLVSEKTAWLGMTFPVAGSSIISQHESAIVLGAAGGDSMFEASVGIMFYCTKIADAYNPMHTFGIDPYRFGHTVLFIRHAAKMLQALDYAGTIHVEVNLASMRGAVWHYEHGIGTHSGSELDDDVEFSDFHNQ